MIAEIEREETAKDIARSKKSKLPSGNRQTARVKPVKKPGRAHTPKSSPGAAAIREQRMIAEIEREETAKDIVRSKQGKPKPGLRVGVKPSSVKVTKSVRPVTKSVRPVGKATTTRAPGINRSEINARREGWKGGPGVSAREVRAELSGMPEFKGEKSPTPKKPSRIFTKALRTAIKYARKIR
jgi:hypothetical protein